MTLEQIPWEFTNVYDKEHPFRGKYINFLYTQLKERLTLKDANISHTKLPTWEEHVNFVESEPYKFWDIIASEDDPSQCIGYLYVTNKNELGIHIAQPFRRRGYAKSVLLSFICSYPEEVFYANINPKNEPSIKLFQSIGFAPLQLTLRLAARANDA